MTRMINQRDLRNDSGKILRAVAGGETFIVASNGTPVAELRPLPRKQFVSKDELRSGMNLPPIDYAKMRADLDEYIDPYLFHD